MKTLIFVSCGIAKLSRKAMAQDMYTSSLFKYARAYAEIHADWWYILSAKHGMLHPNKIIEPYDETIIGGTLDQKRVFANKVDSGILDFIRRYRDEVYKPTEYWPDGSVKHYGRLSNLRVITLCGKEYDQALARFAGREEVAFEKPLQGLQIGQRVSWLKVEVERHQQEGEIQDAGCLAGPVGD